MTETQAVDMLAWLEAIHVQVEGLRLTCLFGFGLMIGSQLWRNFILAKNQRDFF
jgi:hypothetical protein